MRTFIQRYGIDIPSCLFALCFALALTYTYKIDLASRTGDLVTPGASLFAWGDLYFIVVVTLSCLVFLPRLFRLLDRGEQQKVKSEKRKTEETALRADIKIRRSAAVPTFYALRFTLFAKHRWPLLAALMCASRVPFLLALYPAPGMNDTVFMMDNPLYAAVQFPWFYSLVYGKSAEWAAAVLGSREPVIFVLSLLQTAIMSAVLTAFCAWLSRRAGKTTGMILYLYFLLFPMVGNYSIAAVRDGLFSTGLFLWMWLFLRASAGAPWDRGSWGLWGAASFFTLLFRNNGLFLMVPLTALLVYRYKLWKLIPLFLLSAALAIAPGQAILRSHGWAPLFQESMAIPIQQMGRALVMEGDRSPEAAAFMEELLPEQTWKEEYSPYTVDFVKWHDDFRRLWLDDHKKEFLYYWAETGLKNPRLYVEGYLTETYALWNLDPLEHQVQSRFGWALSDDNTKNMRPADNDRLAVGDFPMPVKLKSFFAVWTFEGSRFLGAGFSLWLTLLLSLYFYKRKRWAGLSAAAPLVLNTATLLLATPASAVFRYSFAYVLGLPVLLAWAVLGQSEKRKA